MTDRCKQCEKALNGVNGRFCMKLKKNVEWAEKTPCEDDKCVDAILTQ